MLIVLVLAEIATIVLLAKIIVDRAERRMAGELARSREWWKDKFQDVNDRLDKVAIHLHRRIDNLDPDPLLRDHPDSKGKN